MAEDFHLGKLLVIDAVQKLQQQNQANIDQLPDSRRVGKSWFQGKNKQMDRITGGLLANWNRPEIYARTFTDLPNLTNPFDAKKSIWNTQIGIMDAKKAQGLTGHHPTAIKTLQPLLSKLFQQKRYGLISGLLHRLSDMGYKFEDAEDVMQYIDPGAHKSFKGELKGALASLGVTKEAFNLDVNLQNQLARQTAHAKEFGGTGLRIGSLSLKPPAELADITDNADELVQLVAPYLDVQKVASTQADKTHRILTGAKDITGLTAKLAKTKTADPNALLETVQMITNAAKSPGARKWLTRAGLLGGAILASPISAVASHEASKQQLLDREAEVAANPNDAWLKHQLSIERGVEKADAATVATAEDPAYRAIPETVSTVGSLYSMALDFGRWIQKSIPKPTYPLNPRQPYEDQLNSTKQFR